MRSVRTLPTTGSLRASHAQRAPGLHRTGRLCPSRRGYGASLDKLDPAESRFRKLFHQRRHCLSDGGVELFRRKATIGFALLIVIILSVNVIVMGPSVGRAKAWYEGNPLSEAYPNYGIHDIVSNMSLYLLKERF